MSPKWRSRGGISYPPSRYASSRRLDDLMEGDVDRMIAHTDGGVHRRGRTSATDWAATEPPAPATSSDQLDHALSRVQETLLASQHADGYWCGELEGDSILESEYVLMMAFL